jgi:hypothetical protein
MQISLEGALRSSIRASLSAGSTGGENMQILPEGVWVPSTEGQTALIRAKERSGAIAAHDAKPARLAAATIKTMDPERQT